jgi:putative hydrolase of HD superfamily
MTIASREQAAGQPIDFGKIAQMVLVHDITESRTGEVDYISRQYVDRKEELAIDDIFEDTSVAVHFKEIWEEYEKRESLEAKIAKDADNLDVDFELAEQAVSGYSLEGTWKELRNKVAETKLFTQSAKDMYACLEDVSPHDWHTFSKRNRHNAGDWKK